MIIQFRIKFKTKPDETVFVTGSSSLLGNYDPEKAFMLTHLDKDEWSGKILCEAGKERLLYYKYFIRKNDGTIYFEAGGGRRLALNSITSKIESRDQWQGNTADAPFLTDPFSHVFSGSVCSPYTQTHRSSFELIIRVVIPNVSIGCNIYICGSSKEMGEWDVKKGVKMARLKGLKWVASFSTEHKEGERWEYKFIEVNEQSGEVIWESGENRVVEIPQISRHETVIVEHSSALLPSRKPKFAGVSIPLFSLKSEKSCGIGEISDLKLLIDWAKKTEMSIIQLLPINDTAEHLNMEDAYPYNCISSIALNPAYLSPLSLGHLKDKAAAKEMQTEIHTININASVDYEDVMILKMKYFHAIYEQNGEDTFAQPEYYKFIKANKEWLYPYAVFCALRDKYKTADFRTWKKYSLFSQKNIDALCSAKSELKHNIFFYVYLQYHLHVQMNDAILYAHKKGVALKGDIPIGMSRNSVDAWQYPMYFNFGQQAGAPPDYYSAEGQNWGFPTYNWEEMARDNYKWWKRRLRSMSDYFDAYRIDHILGFFRIWEIPYPKNGGKNGHFSPVQPYDIEEIESYGFKVPVTKDDKKKRSIADKNQGDIADIKQGLFIEDPYHKCKWEPSISAKETKEYKVMTAAEKTSFDALYNNFFFKRNNDLWYRNAMKKLQQLIATSNMLACGEDLGMLAEPVHRCMEELKILSLELQIMPKSAGVSFADPATFPYLSVCTTSTHDSETLRMWLGKREETLKFKSPDTGEVFYDAAPEECKKVLEKNLAAPSMLAIFPLQDWMSINGKLRNRFAYSERINNPGIPSYFRSESSKAKRASRNWRYRMHITLEQLLDATSLNDEISALLKNSDR